MEAPEPHDPAAVPPEDVAKLVSERDALRQQVEQLATKRRRGARSRGLLAGLLVFLYGVLFITSGLGIWLHRNTLNSDVWQERVIPLGEDPAVQRALADWATTQLMQTVDAKALLQDALPDKARVLAVPLSAAVETFVRQRVDEFFASERFEKLWAAAATQAHDQAIQTLRDERPAVTADDEKVTINLVPLLDSILNDALQAAPGLVGSDVKLPTVSVRDTPQVARDKLGEALGIDLSDGFGTITVYDGGKLSTAQRAVRLFDKLVILTTILTVVAAGAALWVSTRRRRTLLQLVGATALACIVVRRATFLVQDQVLQLLKEDQTQAAVRVVLLTFAAPLTHAAGLALWIVAIVGLVAAITGPYPWAVALRGSAARVAGTARGAVVERATDDRTTAWMVANADALRIGGYVAGGIALWVLDLSWAVLFLVVAAVAAWQVYLGRLAPAPDDEGPDATPPDADPSAPLAAG